MVTVPNFKDFAAADVAAFLNHDEFATLHTIDGRQMWVIVDSDQQGSHIPSMQNAQPPSYAEGVFALRKTIYVDPFELGYRPEEDQFIEFDHDRLRVKGLKDEDGLLMIVLEANTS